MLVRESGRYVATRHLAQPPIDAFAESCCRSSMGAEQGFPLTDGDPRRISRERGVQVLCPWSCLVQAIEHAVHLADEQHPQTKEERAEWLSLVSGLDKNLIVCTLIPQLT
jgi:hypothetical protein